MQKSKVLNLWYNVTYVIHGIIWLVVFMLALVCMPAQFNDMLYKAIATACGLVVVNGVNTILEIFMKELRKSIRLEMVKLEQTYRTDTDAV